MSTDELKEPAGTPSESLEDADPLDLAAEIEFLAEENQRLRNEYTRTRQIRYHRSAIGLIAAGSIAAVGGYILPESRTLLIAIAATGVFAGLLTYYLTPERFIPATIGEAIYTALADTEARIATELNLQDDHVYLSTANSPQTARLFIPQHPESDLPSGDALSDVFVNPNEDHSRGISFTPTGDPLFREFEDVLTTPLSTQPGELAAQLADGLVEHLELADSATSDVDSDANRITIRVIGSTFSAIDQFDHPIPSFFGVGLANGLDKPIRVELHDIDTESGNALIECSWPPEHDADTTHD